MNTIKDSETGITYCPQVPEEKAYVAAIKRKLRRFQLLSPDVSILPYDEREDLKGSGWLDVRNEHLSMEHRADGAELIMKAHYMRSVWNALEKAKRVTVKVHPGFYEYACHYTATDGVEGLSKSYGEDIAQILLGRFPPAKDSRIAPGHTDWGTK